MIEVQYSNDEAYVKITNKNTHLPDFEFIIPKHLIEDEDIWVHEAVEQFFSSSDILECELHFVNFDDQRGYTHQNTIQHVFATLSVGGGVGGKIYNSDEYFELLKNSKFIFIEE